MPDAPTREVAEPRLPIPTELGQALDPAWLTQALAFVSGGAPVASVEAVEKIETMAAKVRIVVRFEGDDRPHHFCLKAFLGERSGGGAGATAIREAEFYNRIAPKLTMRVPEARSIIDHEAGKAILIMEDMIEAGAQFCSALEPFTADDAAGTLEQIARLHAGSGLLDDNAWIPSRLDFIVETPHFTVARLQELMDGPRTRYLTKRTADAALLTRGMEALRNRFRDGPKTILHGDCHAGNFYRTADGPGVTDWQLIQRGNWAQDVAYHIAAVLPIELAEQEERALVDHYRSVAGSLGVTLPDAAQAWEDYRAAQIYGYYHWAITQKVEPEITETFNHRLGAGIERHGTYDLLGL